jgi:hypothetical protein
VLGSHLHAALSVDGLGLAVTLLGLLSILLLGRVAALLRGVALLGRILLLLALGIH